MNEQVINLLQKKWVIPTAVGVASFSVGAGIGYIIGKRRPPEYDVTDERDDGQMELNFESTFSDAPVYDLEEKRKSLETYIEEQKTNHPSFRDQYTEWELDEDAELSIEEQELDDGEEVVNVFAGSDEEWDYENELSTRSPDAPYIIHVDEFMAAETPYIQSTVTYYEGDDIMCDVHDTPIYNWANIMTDGNGLRFGHGSKDQNLLFVRNDTIEMEWEILRHSGRFEVEVLGMEVEHSYDENELRHSLRRFRAAD